VILVDANLLIYAIDTDSPQHERARPWLERVLSDAAPVGLPWVVILAFVRITTRAGIMRRPLAPADALAYVDSWLRQPCVEVVAPGEQHWPILRRLLEASGTAGNLTSDPHSRRLPWNAAPRSARPITTSPVSRASGTSTPLRAG
jgi:toxin-antitoxin system PIN domain toxin